MMAGLIATAKLHLVSGALEINTAQAGVKPFIVMADEAPLNVTDERFVAWLDKVQEAGCAAGTVPHGSAHQVSSVHRRSLTTAESRYFRACSDENVPDGQ